jgi:hypothetical protein
MMGRERERSPRLRVTQVSAAVAAFRCSPWPGRSNRDRAWFADERKGNATVWLEAAELAADLLAGAVVVHDRERRRRICQDRVAALAGSGGDTAGWAGRTVTAEEG